MRKKRRTLESLLIIMLLFATNVCLIACGTLNDTSFGDSIEPGISEGNSSNVTSEEKFDSNEYVPGDDIVKDPYTDFE